MLQEEQSRLAEGRYREQVRQELKSQAGITPSPSRKADTLRYILVAIGVVVVLCVGILVGVHRQSAAESTPGQSSVVSIRRQRAQRNHPASAAKAHDR